MNNFPSPQEYFCYTPEAQRAFVLYYRNRKKTQDKVSQKVSDLILVRAFWEALVLRQPLLPTKRRMRDISVYRAVYCHIVRNKTVICTTEIARIMGIDHSSVIYASNKCEDLLDINDKQCVDIYSKVQDVFIEVGESLS